MAEGSPPAGSPEESLEFLDRLMVEFFSPTTGNEKKKQIERTLESFEKQADAWKYCIYFIEKSTNQYVSMFGLTTLENIINKRWAALSHSERDELRQCLWTYFVNSSQKNLAFVQNKLAKLISDVARVNWPMSFPTFLGQINELVVKDEQTCVLGVLIIQAFVEGLGNTATKSNLVFLSPEKRKELYLHFVPQLLNIIINVLGKYTGHSNSVNSNNSLPDLLVSSQASNRCDNPEYKEKCIKICLVTLQQLFSCLPQASHLPANIFPLIFYWANITAQTEPNEEICVIALSTMNEILYQRHVSTDSSSILYLTIETTKLLRNLTSPSHNPHLNMLSHIYINKVSEFLQQFIALYFKRLDSEPDFDALGFLLLIFHFTFQVPMCSNFFNCLEIWTQFINILKPQDSPRYSGALLGLIEGIMNKIQFQCNDVQLQQLDRKTVNDDGETEWQIFLRNCIELIAKITELAPLHIFKLIQNIWQELAEVHDNMIATQNQLYDLASLTQLLGRLAPILFQDKDESILDQCTLQGGLFLERLIKVIQCGSNLIENPQSYSKILIDAYMQVLADTLACLGSWSYYIPRCKAPSCSVSSLLQIASKVLLNKPEYTNSPVLCHAAAHMILSITVTLRPPNALQEVPELYFQGQHSLTHFQPKTASVIRQALCMMILECPMDTSDNTSGVVENKRLLACQSLIEAWCLPLLSPMSNSSPCQCLVCLPALTHLLDYFIDHPMQTKKFLAAATERVVNSALEVFQSNIYDVQNGNDGNIAQLVLELFLALLRTLHQQLKATFITNSIHLFLEIAKRKKHGALHHLLRVLKVAIEYGSLGTNSALEEVINMCLEHIVPLVHENNADTDVVEGLFDLFGSILLNRWQYFYSSCVRQGWSPVAPEGSNDGAKIDRMPQFYAIINAMSETFVTDNIEVVRLNLQTFDALNVRYKLYSKVIFQQRLLGNILNFLLGNLIHLTPVGTLLQEEICTICYNLAAVDFNAYFESFLPTYLGTLPHITPEEIQTLLHVSKESDLPTFTQNLLRWTFDVRSCQMTKEIAF